MNTYALPSRDEMVRAFLASDPTYEGIFVTAVRTTGIFCRTACTAKKPKPQNVDFFPTPREALLAGFRPCKRCRPLEPAGATPDWVQGLLREVDADPSRPWKDQDLREMGLSPSRVRRWFSENHGMTFHAYSRSRRLGNALGRIQLGDSVTRAAFESGYDSLSGFHQAFRNLAGEPPTATRGAPVIHVTRIATPLGAMVAGATDEALLLLEFADRRMLPTQLKTLRRRLGCVFVPGQTAVHDRVGEELDRYFGGGASVFQVPIRAPGTDFQMQVWDELRRIPPGTTISYGQLAARLGRPAAVRAVAKANGDNRIALVIPCHRVIGSDGQLTGYGGGLWRKKKLLELEGGFLT